jgi:hypothetical protein
LKLVIIDSSGNETIVASSKLPQSIRYGAGLEWSPDGNFLAFYVQNYDQLGYWFMTWKKMKLGFR